MESVPLATPMACGTPMYRASRSSKRAKSCWRIEHVDDRGQNLVTMMPEQVRVAEERDLG